MPRLERMGMDAAGREVRLTHPGKVMFLERGWSKLDVPRHYLACAEGPLRGCGRPVVLKRWPDGIAGEPCYQKRAPKTGWGGGAVTGAAIQEGPPAESPSRGAGGYSDGVGPRGRPETAGGDEHAVVRFPSGRSAELLVPRHPADILWMVQLHCLDLHPWPVRADDVDQPDELRLDLPTARSSSHFGSYAQPGGKGSSSAISASMGRMGGANGQPLMSLPPRPSRGHRRGPHPDVTVALSGRR